MRLMTAPPQRFQFALPRGERHEALLKLRMLAAFQFALPRGERRNQLFR